MLLTHRRLDVLLRCCAIVPYCHFVFYVVILCCSAAVVL